MQPAKIEPAPRKNAPYSGYYKRDLPKEDAEITRTDAGTPMGELMRRFWQPVCLSEELKDVPKAIRIMGENLVAFRDLSGRVGVMQRNCAHRGASLEYGVLTDKGVRCCYHGWHFDVDGRVHETPCEPADSRLKESVTQGAYPAREYLGLVFAYMGPPESQPPFPEFDAFHLPKGTRIVPFSNFYPCNWLQVFENIMDHMHTAVLHNNMTSKSASAEDAAGLNLQGFGDMPVMHWEPTRNGNGCLFIAGRRVGEDRVWTRITEMWFPNFLQIGSLVPTAARERHSTVGCTRWNVPVDDTNMFIFGFRHYNDEVDPDKIGKPEDCGVDKIDFLVGQVGDRPYEVGQRAPGDWEAIVSQRPIAIHALENPGRSDVGVYLCRRLLREAVRGKTPADTTRTASLNAGDSLPMYSHDTVLHAPRRPGDEDRKLIHELGLKVLAIMKETDALPSGERDAHVRRRLDELDGGLR